MRLFSLAICFLLLSSSNLFAKTVYDIDLPDTITVSGEQLQLNGYGLRKKFFFKIYLGSLYT
ncbi:MAG: chalcone isomerase family protein, partial [Desulfuromusa sp.]|nr:chalcone isomerase family protein [Desulfuromusa sp.]